MGSGQLVRYYLARSTDDPMAHHARSQRTSFGSVRSVLLPMHTGVKKRVRNGRKTPLTISIS